MPSFLTGLLSGFNESASEGRKVAREQEDAQLKREMTMLSDLTGSSDPEVAAASVSALAELAAGVPRPKGGYLQRIIGGGATAIHPTVQHVLNLMKTPVIAPGIPTRGLNPAALQAPSGASMAMPAKAATQPGGGPASPGMLASTSGAPPPPPVSAAEAQLPTAQPLPAAFTKGAPTGELPSGLTQPRKIFLTPDEQMARTTMAKTRADLDAKRDALRSLGVSEEEIQQTLIRDIGGRTGYGAGGQGSIQGVAGETPDGQPAFGILDKRPASPTYGRYIDPDTDQIIPGFRPRTAVGSTSMGADREALARAKYGKPFVQLTQAQQQDVNAAAVDVAGQRTFATTTARGVAEAGVPLSTQQRFQAITDLQTDWRKLEAPHREMQRQYQLMQTGLERFRAGDKIGGSQAVLVTFQKILDPTSVVRESEYERSPEGLSLLERLRGYAERLGAGGAGVPDTELAAMVGTAQQFLAGMENWNASEAERIDRTARGFGIDPTLIRSGATPPPNPPGATVTPGRGGAGGATPTPGGPPGPPLGTKVQEGTPLVKPRMGDPYTGEIRKLTNGTLLGNVNGVIVELTTMDGGRTYHILKVHQ